MICYSQMVMHHYLKHLQTFHIYVQQQFLRSWTTIIVCAITNKSQAHKYIQTQRRPPGRAFVVNSWSSPQQLPAKNELQLVAICQWYHFQSVLSKCQLSAKKPASNFNFWKKVKSAYKTTGPAGWAYPTFFGMKQLWVFLHPAGWDASRLTPSIKFAGTHLHTWVERGTVIAKCLTQEHSTMSQLGFKPGLLNPELSTL